MYFWGYFLQILRNLLICDAGQVPILRDGRDPRRVVSHAEGLCRLHPLPPAKEPIPGGVPLEEEGGARRHRGRHQDQGCDQFISLVLLSHTLFCVLQHTYKTFLNNDVPFHVNLSNLHFKDALLILVF